MIEIIEYINGEYVKSLVDESTIMTAQPPEEPLTMDEVLSVLEAALNG